MQFAHKCIDTISQVGNLVVGQDADSLCQIALALVNAIDNIINLMICNNQLSDNQYKYTVERNKQCNNTQDNNDRIFKYCLAVFRCQSLACLRRTLLCIFHHNLNLTLHLVTALFNRSVCKGKCCLFLRISTKCHQVRYLVFHGLVIFYQAIIRSSIRLQQAVLVFYQVSVQYLLFRTNLSHCRNQGIQISCYDMGERLLMDFLKFLLNIAELGNIYHMLVRYCHGSRIHPFEVIDCRYI